MAAQFDTKKNNGFMEFSRQHLPSGSGCVCMCVGSGVRSAHSTPVISTQLLAVLAHSTLEANILTQKRSKGFLKWLING